MEARGRSIGAGVPAPDATRSICRTCWLVPLPGLHPHCPASRSGGSAGTVAGTLPAVPHPSQALGAQDSCQGRHACTYPSSMAPFPCPQPTAPSPHTQPHPSSPVLSQGLGPCPRRLEEGQHGQQGQRHGNGHFPRELFCLASFLQRGAVRSLSESHITPGPGVTKPIFCLKFD